MIKECIECWKEYKTSKKASKFCSVWCKVANSRLKDIPCAVCWVMFHPSKSTVKTCSKECWYRYMSLWERNCLYCGELFKPEHSTNRYCSKKCWSMANRKYTERNCVICWTSFRPHYENHLCCSIHCWQIYNWNNKTQEEKDGSIRTMISWIKQVSKINIEYFDRLILEWFDVKSEFWIDMYAYDLKVWNILIELNPFPFHNSTRAPNVEWIKPKDKYYHYNKVRCAIENWYNVIMVRDWMKFEDVINIIKTLKSTTQLDNPTLHRYQPKTKEHIIDRWQNRDDMLESWFVEIYDAWEKYIFNSTNI